MDARLLDVLQDAADHRPFAVGDEVDVELGRVLEVAVDQDRVAARDLGGERHELLDRLLVVADRHGAPAEHVARPHEYRVAEPARHGERLGERARRAVLGRRIRSSSSSAPNRSRSSARSIASGRGAPDRHAGRFESFGELERRLAAELDDHAVRLLALVDRQHVLERERLEVEPVGGVVVGRDGLGVAVDHDRLDAELAQREGGVDAAVVELDSLADPVGSGAEDHDLAARGRLGLVLAAEGRVEVGRLRLELGGAGVDPLEHAADAELAPARRHLLGRRGEQRSEAGVAQAVLLGAAQQPRRHRTEVPAGELDLELDQRRHLAQEPGVDVGQRAELLHRPALAQGREDREQPLPVGHGQPLPEPHRVAHALLARRDRTVELERGEPLHQGLAEGGADRHHLADRLHRVPSVPVDPGNFSKAQRGILTTV